MGGESIIRDCSMISTFGSSTSRSSTSTSSSYMLDSESDSISSGSSNSGAGTRCKDSAGLGASSTMLGSSGSSWTIDRPSGSGSRAAARLVVRMPSNPWEVSATSLTRTGLSRRPILSSSMFTGRPLVCILLRQPSIKCTASFHRASILTHPSRSL